MSITRCTACSKVAHVSETDEQGRCADCALETGEPHVLPTKARPTVPTVGPDGEEPDYEGMYNDERGGDE